MAKTYGSVADPSGDNCKRGRPKALANTAKHLVFTRCGELNLNGVVDAQIAVLESELLT
jgi:hypothetical protein